METLSLVITIAAIVLGVILLLRILAKPFRFIFKLLLNTVLGFVLLWIINFFGGEIGITLRRQAHTAVLSVVNAGDEIPPDKLEHLFDRFYRLDEARSGEGEHYGLGLSIAKAVAQKHGGSIAASCADGKVRFTVSLPVKK